MYTFLLLPLSAPPRAPTRSVLHLDLSSAVPEAGGAHARPRYPFLSLSPTRIARGRIGNEASFHHRSIPLWQPLLVRRSGTSMLPDTGERAFRASTVLPLGHPRRRARTSAHFIGLGRGEDGSLLRDLAHLCALCPRPTRDFSTILP